MYQFHGIMELGAMEWNHQFHGIFQFQFHDSIWIRPLIILEGIAITQVLLGISISHVSQSSRANAIDPPPCMVPRYVANSALNKKGDGRHHPMPAHHVSRYPLWRVFLFLSVMKTSMKKVRVGDRHGWPSFDQSS